MKRYIDADEAYKALNEITKGKPPQYCGVVEDCVQAIDEVPDADVAEVIHASWKWGHMNGKPKAQYGIWCTNCGAGWVDSENAEWIAFEHDFCGKCGAKMDAERKDQP